MEIRPGRWYKGKTGTACVVDRIERTNWSNIGPTETGWKRRLKNGFRRFGSERG